VLLSMIGVFWTVFSIEKKNAQYNTNEMNYSRSRKYIKEVSLKCVLYVLAFEITWFFNLWGVVEFWVNTDNDHERAGPESEGGWTKIKYLLNLALLPTYGIWSSIAYFILPFLKMRREQPEWGFFKKLGKTVIPVSTSRTEGRQRGRIKMLFGRSRDSDDAG